MSNHLHVNRHGNKTRLKNLELSHLKNIIAFLEKLANDGITIRYGGMDAEDIWYDEEFLIGKDALIHMNYYKYIEELSRRDAQLKRVSNTESEEGFAPSKYKRH